MLANYRIDIAGTNALIVYFFHPEPQMQQGLAASFFKSLQEQALPWVTNMVPAFHSVLVEYDVMQVDVYRAKHGLKHYGDKVIIEGAEASLSLNDNRLLTIQVCYSHPEAMDLEVVAAQCKMDVKQLITLHSQTEYRVEAIGFAPGFAYMGSLDRRLRLPRRTTPRVKIPAGAVAIANAYTAIYPNQSPGGWHVIGLSPMPLFNLNNDPPMPYEVGDRIRFSPISHAQYCAQMKVQHE